MDSLTVVVGLLVASFGASVLVSPVAVVRALRPDRTGEVDPKLNRTRRTFGAIAALLGTYAVAVGVGLA